MTGNYTQMPKDDKTARILSDEEVEIVNQLREARAQKKQWEEQEQRCRSALLEVAEDAELLYHDGKYVADIESRSSTRFDRKTFAKDWKELDRSYSVPTKSKVINLIGD